MTDLASVAKAFAFAFMTLAEYTDAPAQPDLESSDDSRERTDYLRRQAEGHRASAPEDIVWACDEIDRMRASIAQLSKKLGER